MAHLRVGMTFLRQNSGGGGGGVYNRVLARKMLQWRQIAADIIPGPFFPFPALPRM